MLSDNLAVMSAEASRRGIFLDLHVDTLSRILEEGLDAGAFLDPGAVPPGKALQVDLEGARAAGLHGLVLAAFAEPPGAAGKLSGARAGLEMAALLREIGRLGSGRAALARSAGDLLDRRGRGLLSLILSLENAGDLCEGSLRVLEMFRELGARLAGLVWFARNPFGSGVGDGSDPGGLSPRGKEAVRAMGRMGMAVDVSHLNREGVKDVLAEATGPVVATHSNARALCDHPRNLDDGQIREIAARGGAIGLCLFPKFLRDPSRGQASAEDAVRHLEHIAQVGGIGCIASGSDFDGIRLTPEGIQGIRDLARIPAALRERGWSEEEIGAYCGANALRVLESLGD